MKPFPARKAEVQRRLNQAGIASAGDDQETPDNGRTARVEQQSRIRPHTGIAALPLFSQCFDLLRKMRSCGVVHGDIRAENLLLGGGTPRLRGLGWCPPLDSPASRSGEHLDSPDAGFWIDDFRAVGQVLAGLGGDAEPLQAVARLMASADERFAIRDLDLLQPCLEAIATYERNSDDADCEADDVSSNPSNWQATKTITALLTRLGREQQHRGELASRIRQLEARQHESQLSAVAAELGEYIPQPDRFLLIDGEQWRAQLPCAERAIPFLEKSGTYWGLPANDDQAIAELDRQQANGIYYLVLAEPMYWWLESYPTFFQHLRKHFKRCHNSNRVMVFRTTGHSINLRR